MDGFLLRRYNSAVIGQPAPDFELEGSDGRTHRLADFRGKKVVLIFYPMNKTPG